ncbi:MAG TPA: TetR/AcrR family transcriptional regulator [Devosiaceae bacterium]|nr:TetR/AcrR family transcriptional regulator [Devosiaceae bacterium]
MRVVKSAIIRKQELLDAAMRLIAAKGYDETSVSDVIAEVGISKGAFYHHFDSKEGLIEALAERYAAESAGRAQSLLEDETLDAFERLSSFLSRLRNQKAEVAPELFAAFAPIFRPENIRLYERTQSAANAIIRPMLARIITEGVAERTFDTSDPEGATDIILHLMTSNRPMIAALYAARTPDQFEARLSRLVERMRYLGTVIDRILGIPEGSIELTDQESVCAFSESWHGAAVAAE